ncbi:MAG: epoxyqueuosine reductase QueH [Thermoplasmata archaeon]
MRRLVLHVCCGPCSTEVVERLRPDYELTLFFYNPNIYPKEEHDRRLAEAERYALHKGLTLVKGDWSHEEWLRAVRGLEAEPEGGRRCERCFELRLRATARLASELGAELFTTTLTVSPHKNAAMVNAAGRKAAEDIAMEPGPGARGAVAPLGTNGVGTGALEGEGGAASGMYMGSGGTNGACREGAPPERIGAAPRFLAADFKKRDGFLRSCRLAREAGMRRQSYCGCEFSMAGRRRRVGGDPGSRPAPGESG